MSFVLARFDNNIYDENSRRIYSFYISNGKFYNQFWGQAVIDTRSIYFRENGEFDISDLDKVLKELDLQKEWAEEHLSDQDLIFMKSQIEDIQKDLIVECKKIKTGFILFSG